MRWSAALIGAHSDLPRWQGRRVLALDGTTLRLPDTPECAGHFGGQHTACGRFRVMARASVLLDVARGCIVDAHLGRYCEDERSLAQAHLDCLGEGDLLVADRGYPSREWMDVLQTKGVGFCMRIRDKKWNAVARSGQCDALADLGTPQAPLPLRLLRVVHPNGAMLILATNLFDPAIGPDDFAQLYHKRWDIEEAFKLLKARLHIENWSGILPHTVEQDFMATLVRANCAAALCLESRPDLPLPTTEAKTVSGWRVRINRTLASKTLHHKLPRLLLGIDMAGGLQLLLERLRSPGAVERTRSGRTDPRNAGVRIADFHFACNGD